MFFNFIWLTIVNEIAAIAFVKHKILDVIQVEFVASVENVFVY